MVKKTAQSFRLHYIYIYEIRCEVFKFKSVMYSSR